MNHRDMQSKISIRSFIFCLLAASQCLYSNVSLAVVGTAPDLTPEANFKPINDSAKANTNRGRAVTITPKWSLPFQGQLVGATSEDQKKESLAKSSNGLSLFKPKNTQILTISPPETLKNNLIADTNNGNTAVKTNGKFISGEVSVWDGDFDVDRIVSHLLDTHFENSAQGKQLDKQVKRHSGLGHRAIAVTKDGLNEAFGYQGIEPSVRAGKLVLESPDIKIRNKAWAEYVRQRYIDKIHAQVVASLMQIAEGIGNSESEHGAQTIAAGKAELGALVGDEEAERAVKALTQWLNNTNIPYANFAQAPWSTIERTKKFEEVLTSAIEHDPVIDAVTKRVNKYANPSTLNKRSSQVITTTLNGAALLTPGYIGSIVAEGILVGYKLGTGGSEENKLERELLLDKRIQSRLKVLSQETALALDNYRFALVTKNPPLLAFSQELVENLTGNPKSLNPAGVPVADLPDAAVPELRESEQGTNQGAKKFSTVKYLVKNTNSLLN